MLTFGTHKVVQQRCLQKVLPGVRYKMPSSCLFCCLMISIVPTTFLLGETVINPSLFVFPMSLMISIYISSHTFSLSEKSQIKRSCFFPSIWYPRWMRRLQVVFGMQTPSGTVALSRMYIHVCVCGRVLSTSTTVSPTVPFAVLSKLGEGISAGCRPHSLLIPCRTCPVFLTGPQ